MKDETSAFVSNDSSNQIHRACKAGPLKPEVMLNIDV